MIGGDSECTDHILNYWSQYCYIKVSAVPDYYNWRYECNSAKSSSYYKTVTVLRSIVYKIELTIRSIKQSKK